MDLMAAAVELYSLRPGEFVARRSELADEAKGGGDRSLAAEIGKLAKPSTAAWVVNVLVRHEPDQVAQVLDLGAALRQAQDSMAGDELRQLGRQRRQLIAAVTRQARALAGELGQNVGHPVAAQVEDTLYAAMIDEDAAKAVRTGLLVKPLSVAGTEASAVVESVAVPGALGEAAVRRAPAPRKKPAAKSEKPDLTVVADNSRAIEEAESELAEAEGRLTEAERKLDKAKGKLAKREARGLQLQAELDELRRRLSELEQRVEANEDDLTQAEEAVDEREDALAEARTAVEQAQQELRRLRQDG